MNGAIRKKGGQMRVPRHARCYSEPRYALRGGITKEKKINARNESNWKEGRKENRPIEKKIEIGQKFERTRIAYRKLLLEEILLIRSVSRHARSRLT